MFFLTREWGLTDRDSVWQVDLRRGGPLWARVTVKWLLKSILFHVSHDKQDNREFCVVSPCIHAEKQFYKYFIALLATWRCVDDGLHALEWLICIYLTRHVNIISKIKTWNTFSLSLIVNPFASTVSPPGSSMYNFNSINYERGIISYWTTL